MNYLLALYIVSFHEINIWMDEWINISISKIIKGEGFSLLASDLRDVIPSAWYLLVNRLYLPRRGCVADSLNLYLDKVYYRLDTWIHHCVFGEIKLKLFPDSR